GVGPPPIRAANSSAGSLSSTSKRLSNSPSTGTYCGCIVLPVPAAVVSTPPASREAPLGQCLKSHTPASRRPYLPHQQRQRPPARRGRPLTDSPGAHP